MPVKEERSYRGLKAVGVEKSMIMALKAQVAQVLEPEFDRVTSYNRWQTIEKDVKHFTNLARKEAARWATASGFVDEQLHAQIVEFSDLHTALVIRRMADQEFSSTWDDDDFDD